MNLRRAQDRSVAAEDATIAIGSRDEKMRKK
jgi:hypothetical protein